MRDPSLNADQYYHLICATDRRRLLWRTLSTTGFREKPTAADCSDSIGLFLLQSRMVRLLCESQSRAVSKTKKNGVSEVSANRGCALTIHKTGNVSELPVAEDRAPIALLLASDDRLHISPGADAATLRTVLSVLRERA
jgi:hypothetical protein